MRRKKPTIYEVRYSIFRDGAEERHIHLIYGIKMGEYIAQLKGYGFKGITIIPHTPEVLR